MNRTITLLLLCGGLLAFGCADPNVSFTIIQMNDVYEIAPVQGGKYGGLARVATLKKQLEEENPNVLLVLSGDFLSPSLIATLEHNGEKIAGAQMIETLNALGLDVATFGNHEFDLKKYDDLQKRMNESDFNWVSANVLHQTGTDKGPFFKLVNGDTTWVPSHMVYVFENKDGVEARLGVTGVTLPYTKRDYVFYDNYTASLRRELNALDTTSNVQIVLTHLEVEQDKELAKDVPGFELFLGGHDHDNMIHLVDNTTITKADANAKSVYVHKITVNTETGESIISTELKEITNAISADSAVNTVVQKWTDLADEVMRSMGYDPYEVIWYTDSMLDGLESSIRNQPTAYGKLVANSFTYVYPEADVALFNSGSMRVDDQLTGDITQFDILRSFPFGGTVALVELDGKTLKQLLTVGEDEKRGTGAYLQTIRVERQEEEWLLNGAPIEDNKQYKVAMTEYLAGGNEAGMEFLKEFTPQAPESFQNGTIHNDIRAVVIAYMKSL